MSGCRICAAIALFISGGSATAQVSFVDATESSGLIFTSVTPPGAPLPWVGSGAAVADFDDDGDLDVYFVSSFGLGNKLYRNNGDKTFTDVTDQFGVADPGGAGRMALFLDLDNDGDRDLIVGNETLSFGGAGHPTRVYRNDGSIFTDVSEQSNLAPIGKIFGGMAATDYNGDGLVDIYFTYWNDNDPNTTEPFNFLYRNLGGFQFVEESELMGLREPITQVESWTPVFFDVDGDGHQDLFTAVDFDLNYLFLYDPDAPGGARFVDHTIELDVLHDGESPQGNDMGTAVGDCDGDGNLDIFTTNITLTPPNELARTNALFMNHYPDPFTDEARDRGAWQSYWGWGTAFFDVDLDGDLDLGSVGGRDAGPDGTYWADKPSQLFINDGTCHFVDIAAAAGADHNGNSRAYIPFDYDRDGDDDLLIVNVDQPAVLLENVTSTGNHFLALRLTGTARTRDAIGAKVRLTAGGKTQVREIMAGTSFYASLPWEQRFGLAERPIVDEIVVDWPGGAQTIVALLPVDRVVEIVEGVAPAVPAFTGLEISGPSSVAENTTVSYTAIATFDDGTATDLTTFVTWTVDLPDVATISSVGVLTAMEVAADSQVTVTAAYASFSDSIVVTVQDTVGPPASDVVDPVITILTPTTQQEYATDSPTITLAGTAEDNIGVVAVSWRTDGDDNPCDGTSEWSCGPISLVEGDTVVTITAKDEAGNTAEAMLAVTLAPPSEAPVLTVFPMSLDFGETKETDVLAIGNAGGGELSYTVTCSEEWLTVDPETGTVGGGDSPIEHVLTVERSGFSPGMAMSAEVTITDTEDTVASVVVGVTASAPPAEPEIPMTAIIATSLDTIDLGDSQDSGDLLVWNAGDGVLEYALTVDADWVEVDPGSGSSADETDVGTHTIVISRDGFAAGEERSAALTITDVHDSAVAVVVTIRAARPADPPPTIDDDPGDDPPDSVDEPVVDPPAGDVVPEDDTDDPSDVDGGNRGSRGGCGFFGLIALAWTIGGLGVIRRRFVIGR